MIILLFGLDLLGLLDSFSVTDSLTDFVGELGVFFVDDLEGVLVGDFGHCFSR